MTTVYLVSDGDYSDYSIRGVYSTAELAERARILYHADGVEEYELDDMPDAPSGMVGWGVQMDRNGDTYNVSGVSAGTVNDNSLGWVPKYVDCIEFVMFAIDAVHAVKIANERRTRMIADGEWTTDHGVWFARMSEARAAREVQQ